MDFNIGSNAGNAGQKFKEDQLKIRSLREKFPNVKIEVDGGVVENALAIKNGAIS